MPWKTTPRRSAWSNEGGKLQILPLVWSFAFDFAAGERRTLAGFRRSYDSTADEPLSPGGYYQRLTPSLAEYLCDLVEFGLDEVAVPHTVADGFEPFRDLIIVDGTILRLHQFLSDTYEGREEEQAGSTAPLAPQPQRSDARTVQHHRREGTRQHGVFHRVVARRSVSSVRPGVVQLPAVRLDRRERRPLRESAETGRKSGDNGRITGMAWRRHSLGRDPDPRCC